MQWKLPVLILSSIIGLGASQVRPIVPLVVSALNTPTIAVLGQRWAIPDGIDPKTRRILTDLISCESQGNERALNPKDRNGLPSYGLLQFQEATLRSVIKEFDLLPDIEDKEVLNVIYDGNLQIKAFLAMYGEGRSPSWFKSQFPACSQRYNYWL